MQPFITQKYFFHLCVSLQFSHIAITLSHLLHLSLCPFCFQIPIQTIPTLLSPSDDINLYSGISRSRVPYSSVRLFILFNFFTDLFTLNFFAPSFYILRHTHTLTYAHTYARARVRAHTHTHTPINTHADTHILRIRLQSV